MKQKSKGHLHRWFIRFGLLLIAAALLLTACNLYDAARADRSVHKLTERLQAFLAAQYDDTGRDHAGGRLPDELEIPDYMLDPDMEMPQEIIDGQAYIGLLRIPALSLELPVISRWSDSRLRIAPCRYSGSAYTEDMIIAGHNYDSHFGRLKNLSAGDEISFTDMTDNLFRYEVAEMEILQPDAVEEMQAGDWDLTLFTCTLGGRTRVAIRCVRII